MSDEHVPFQDIMAQVDHVFSLPEVRARCLDIRKVILSNNGSVLDETTFSSTALMYFLARLKQHCPHLKVLSMETRSEYVDTEELAFISRALNEGASKTKLELAIGFEAFDDRIRNTLFQKGLPLRTFEKLVERISPFDFHLKCYFMLKPVPGVSSEEAIADIHRAIEYLDAIMERTAVTINMHLNPTYVARGTELEEAFLKGRYVPPTLVDVARAAGHARGTGLSVFLGLFDEGLAVPGGSFLRTGDDESLEKLETFNRTQDYALLDTIGVK